MKKENKLLARERKAKERKKQKLLKVLIPTISISIPSILFLVMVGFIVFNPFWEKTSSTDTNSDNTATESSTLLTDKELAIKNGDTVNIDYVGSIDGVEFDGGNTEGYGTDLTIGSGMYIDNFEEQLIGAHPGDNVDVKVTFPEDYGMEDLNGKEALFKVTINGIYE